jgi:hypothetical protein
LLSVSLAQTSKKGEERKPTKGLGASSTSIQDGLVSP